MDRHGSVLYLALLLCSEVLPSTIKIRSACHIHLVCSLLGFTRVKQEGTNNTCRELMNNGHVSSMCVYVYVIMRDLECRAFR